MRRLATSARVVAAACACALASSACGGGSSEAAKPTMVALPPANPQAVQKFLEAGALIGAKRGDLKRAESLLREALAIDAYLWEAHYDLGLVLLRRGELRSAEDELQAAHRTQPAAGEPLLALADVQNALGKHQSAIDALEEYLEAHADNAADVRVRLTALLREQGQYDAALEQARAVLVRDPKNAGALLEVGRIYRARGELDVAELVFNRALHLDENSPYPHNELGLTALARGDTQLAFGRFEDALKADRGFAPARLNRASVLLHAGDYAAAESEYRKVLAEDAEHDDARVGLAIALRGQGKPKEAATEYERVLDHSPNQASALFDLAVLRAEFQDRRADARALFERFLAVAPEGEARNAAERYLKEIPEGGDAQTASAPAPAPEGATP
jgi:tetratricopeptide (TPR) repeat protein